MLNLVLSRKIRSINSLKGVIDFDVKAFLISLKSFVEKEEGCEYSCKALRDARETNARLTRVIAGLNEKLVTRPRELKLEKVEANNEYAQEAVYRRFESQ
jgi:hypothetical protein